MRPTPFLMLALLGLALVVAGCKGKAEVPPEPTPPPEATPAPAEPPEAEPADTKAAPVEEKPMRAKIVTTKGDIVVELLPKDAPRTVHRFLELVEEGYYNDMPWHRVDDGFVAQTGDGPERPPIPDEVNEHHHKPGAVAMAKPGPRDFAPGRLSEPDSATTQFYICMAYAPHLDREFTVFGEVRKGLEIAQRLTTEDRVTRMVLLKDNE